MPESVVSGGWLCCVREEDEINGCAKYEACSNVHVGSALVLRKSSRAIGTKRQETWTMRRGSWLSHDRTHFAPPMSSDVTMQ